MGCLRPDIFPAPKKQVQPRSGVLPGSQQSQQPQQPQTQPQPQAQPQTQPQAQHEHQQMQQQDQQQSLQQQYMHQMQQQQYMQQQQQMLQQQYMQKQQQVQQHQLPQTNSHQPTDVTSYGYLAQQQQQQKQQQFLSQLRTQQYLEMAKQVSMEPKLGPSDIPIESIPLSVIHAAQEKQGYRYSSEDQQKYADLLFAQQWEIASRQHLKEKEEQRAWQLKLAELAAQSAHLTEQYRRCAAGLPPVGIPPQSEEFKQKWVQQLCERESIIALNPPPGYPISSPTYVSNVKESSKKRKSSKGCVRRMRQACC